MIGIDISDEEINDLIYEIDGKHVILDSDLAMLYGVNLQDITDAVENYPERFPERFSWILSKQDLRKIRSRSTGLSPEATKNPPRVFTEQGAAILTTVLKTEAATKVSLGIMDAFVTMSKYVSDEIIEKSLLDDQVQRNADEIKLLKETFSKMSEKRRSSEIYFEGQIYDAYSKISEIFKSAEKKLTIIDSYADLTILDIVKRLSNIQVILITKQNNLLSRQDVKKYNKQYHNAYFYYDNSFHDRYFIIDDTYVYHCGSSVNKIGSKTFSITMISDKEVCRLLISKVNKIISNPKNSATPLPPNML